MAVFYFLLCFVGTFVLISSQNQTPFCSNYMEIVLIWRFSRSSDTFSAIKNFIARRLLAPVSGTFAGGDQGQIDDRFTRIGLIVYSDRELAVQFDLTKYHTMADYVNDVNSIQNPFGKMEKSSRPYVSDAFEEAVQMLQSLARPYASRTVIIFSDEFSSQDVQQAVREFGVLKQLFAGVFGVGVGLDAESIGDYQQFTDQRISTTAINLDATNPASIAIANALHDFACNAQAPYPRSTLPQTTPAFQTTTTSPSSSGGTNKIRACSNATTNIVLDIIFAIDASQAVGADNYKAFKDHMAAVIRLLTVNQNGGTRVGLIYYADRAYTVGNLSSYQSAQDAASTMENLPYLNIIALNIKDALDDAQQMFSSFGQGHRKQVLVLSSTGCTNCHSSGTKSVCDSIGPDQIEACRVAAQMKEHGVTIMTILLKLGPGDLPPISLASPCSAFTNDPSLTRNLVLGWSSLNCYCGDEHFIQFVNPANVCEKSAECVLLQHVPGTWVTAQTTCQHLGGFLADEFSDTKQVFLKSIAINSGVTSYWIGLNDQASPSTYMWDRGAGAPIPAYPNDYKYWGPGHPNDANGNCIAQSNKVGFQLFWENRKCNDPLTPSNNLNFFCQQNACDTENLCS